MHISVRETTYRYRRNVVSLKKERGAAIQADSPLTPQKITVTTVTTVTELARESGFLHVILCLAEISARFIKHDVFSVHPDPQGRDAAVFLIIGHDVLVFGG